MRVIIDTVCTSGHVAFDVLCDPKDSPPCEECGEGTARRWVGKSPAIHGFTNITYNNREMSIQEAEQLNRIKSAQDGVDYVVRQNADGQKARIEERMHKVHKMRKYNGQDDKSIAAKENEQWRKEIEKVDAGKAETKFTRSECEAMAAKQKERLTNTKHAV
jgi:hypothetical protein